MIVKELRGKNGQLRYQMTDSEYMLFERGY